MTHEFQRDSDAVENKKSHTDYTYDALNRLTGSTRKLGDLSLQHSLLYLHL